MADYNFKDGSIRTFNVEKDDLTNLTSITIPSIHIREFQPDINYATGPLADATIDQLVKMFNDQLKGSSARVASMAALLVGALSSVAKPALTQVNDALANSDPSTNAKYIKYIENMIPGKAGKNYILPFLSDRFYDTVQGNWDQEGGKQYLGKVSEILQKGLSLNVPTVPVWSLSNGDNVKFNFSFYLLNSDQDSFSKNINFLNDLFRGSLWNQVGLIQRSPCLYKITCPGRFYLPWCSLSMSAKLLGKTIDNNGLFNCTEVVQVTLDIASLIPYSKNLFDYYINGKTADTVINVINSTKDVTTGQAAAATGEFVLNPVKQGLTTAASAVTSTVGSAVSTVENLLP